MRISFLDGWRYDDYFAAGGDAHHTPLRFLYFCPEPVREHVGKFREYLGTHPRAIGLDKGAAGLALGDLGLGERIDEDVGIEEESRRASTALSGYSLRRGRI
jgi:hypothetical protein